MVSEELRPYDGCVLPPQASAIEELHDWALNYDSGANPYVIFLDLIGFSEERYGESLYPTPGEYSSVLGYKELCLLANALQVFKDNGFETVYYWCGTLHVSEGLS